MWFKDKPPKAKKAQIFKPEDPILPNLRRKIGKVRNRGYIAKGFVRSLIRYFAVPKGDNDIRLVYDGTSSGFNHSVWAPSFRLPTVEMLLRAVGPNTWMGDIDIGEMFLNFPLHESAQTYCGVDLTTLFPEEIMTDNSNGKLWERWTICLMGAKPSPYQAIRSMLWAEDVLRGNRFDSKNPFRWQSVRLNLPGSEDYDSRLPWVSKVKADGSLAAEFFIYVDDVRIAGQTEHEVWNAVRQISALSGYLGIQDAARKRRPPSKHAGAWAGSMIYTDEHHVGAYIDQAKWDKTKSHLMWLENELKRCDAQTNSLPVIELRGINRKDLERKHCFLVYVSRTYPGMVPYLKGIHLTLDSWRSGRDVDGWRLTLAELRAAKEAYNQFGYNESSEFAPEVVHPVPRLADDVECLLNLFDTPHPTVRHVRTDVITVVLYGFGDASGAGFGSTIQTKTGLRIRHGIWGSDLKNSSSNYREFRNIVETIEQEVVNGTFAGSELFIFTDNIVTEGCFYRGTSSSRPLFDLVLRLRRCEMMGGLKLHVIHVAGTRMIRQGTDGLSRGNYIEGVMAGKDMLSFIPLHQSPLERSHSLKGWVESWLPSDYKFLSVDEWFTAGHGLVGGAKNHDGVWMPSYETFCCVWSPAPAAAFEAAEELNRARHINPDVPHLFLCPRLMTYMWRKSLNKIADSIFYVSPGSKSFWSCDMHEPLIIVFILPFSRSAPWQRKATEPILELERELRSVWDDKNRDEGSILRKF